MRLDISAGKNALASEIKHILGDACWATLEKRDDDREITILPRGLEPRVSRLRSISRGGLDWLGAPCKSWIGLDRSFTKCGYIFPRKKAPPPRTVPQSPSRIRIKAHHTLGLDNTQHDNKCTYRDSICSGTAYAQACCSSMRLSSELSIAPVLSTSTP